MTPEIGSCRAFLVRGGVGVGRVRDLADGSAPTVSGHGIETDAAFIAVRRTADGVEHVALTGGTFADVDSDSFKNSLYIVVSF